MCQKRWRGGQQISTMKNKTQDGMFEIEVLAVPKHKIIIINAREHSSLCASKCAVVIIQRS